MQIKEALQLAVNEFTALNIPAKYLEARLLLAKAIGQRDEYLIAEYQQNLTPGQEQLFLQLVARRKKYEPIAYILGLKEFYGRDFIVNKHVLIPRSETELLVESVTAIYKTQNHADRVDIPVDILELGTGSGAVAITLALEIPAAAIVATDISVTALKVAQNNILKHSVSNQVRLIKSNWYKELAKELPGELPRQKFDFIVANPPYISKNELQYVAKETILFEPEIALYAAGDGLAHYKTIISRAKEYLKPNGVILLETGFRQAESVINLIEDYKLEVIEILKDIQGHERVIGARYIGERIYRSKI